MSKQVNFSQEAREELRKGVNVLANAVKSTLGPEGRNVIIEAPFGGFRVTKDGVTVAREVSLKDPIQNLGVEAVREAATTTVEVVGDGTTTATVLAQHLINRGMDSNVSPVALRQGMNRALTDVLGHLKEMAEPITLDSEKVLQVATISANNDPVLGEAITEAIRAVNGVGIVSVQNSQDSETTVEVLSGSHFDKGYLSPQFVTNTNKMECEFKDPLLLFYDGEIRSIQALAKIIELVNTPEINRPLVVIADDIMEQVLNSLVANKMKAGLRIAVVKAPSFGDHRKDIMQDLAVATGATYISPMNAKTLDNLDVFEDLGQAESVVITKDSTSIIGGAGEEDEILNRINSIKADLEHASVSQKKHQMLDRVAKLKGGAAVIHVGGTTEAELHEKRDRVDDAVAATRAALEEGIVPGGGYALYLIGMNLELDIDPGYDIVLSSLFAPMDHIMSNANISLTDLYDLMDAEMGVNALTGKLCNLREEGIIDPVKVTRVCLENAVSVATTLLSTDVTITIDPEDKPKDMGQFGPMAGY
jgi:chaperonin GroEL